MLSIESQTRELEAVALKLGFKITNIFSEAKSAKDLGRPEFGRLVSMIKEGKIDRILVWHPDRLSRNPQDAATIISLMDSGDLVEVCTPSQTFRNNPMDKFMLGFFMMQAKFENDHKGENVKEGLKTKAEKGYLPSGAKPGYMNDKYAEKGSKKIMNDPVRFPLIKQCWELMLTGAYTPPKILDMLNNEWGYTSPTRKSIGGKPMARSQIYRMLRDPFYYGLFEFPVGSGKWFQGQHEPMVTKEQFNKVQIILGRKGSPSPHFREFAFTGLMKCGECGAMVTAEERWQCVCSKCNYKFTCTNNNTCQQCHTKISEMDNPLIRHYVHYHCTKRKNPNCTQGSVEVGNLEKQIDALMSQVGISERFKDWAIKHLNKLNDQEVEVRNASIGAIQEAYNGCLKKLDNLLQLKISPANSDGSLLSDTDFKSQKDTLMAEKISLEQRMGNAGKKVDEWMNDAEKAFDFAVHCRYKFANATLMQKREMLIILGSDFTITDKTLRLNLQKPYCFLKPVVEEVPSTSAMFGTDNQGLLTAQLEDEWASNPLVLPR